ncbi:NAD(P)-binding protein [Daldinia caldariorum]|uniref:NAD(P)-binding protein n=1 Tax=Daldinia caldariorum TaxID=326644 RepID=UPI002008C1F5|nr:NAD(P)-binding protein [Daldinia caldariorum]KAI1463118.1 NAD(P)-binding protein [Daldinia caldariorum]
MSSLHHVLLLGGSGKVAQLLTPLLLQRSWNVTSIIHDPARVESLQKLGQGQNGKLNVLVRSLEEVASEAQAKSIIDEVKPDYVVWSAGAAGKGGPERTFKIDRDAAIHFIRASAATSSITKFVMISYLGSRLNKAPWWPEEVWQECVKNNNGALKTYYQAKIAADQVLYEEGKKRKDFAAIGLRPGLLTAEPAGRVKLGKLFESGTASRASVAQVTALLLDNPNVKSSWLDLIDGDEDPEVAVKRCVEEGVDAAEGEPF